MHLIKKRPATYGKGLFLIYIIAESSINSRSYRNKIGKHGNYKDI